MLAIGVDIGGTKVAAGVVDEQGTVLERVQLPTPTHSPGAVEDAVVDVVGRLRARHVVGVVGVGAAGWVDTDQSVVRFSPHLAWRNEPIRERLGRRLDLPLLVDNDANAAAWAEYRFGAGRDSSVMVCITLGTGIGGAVVINGAMFRGRYGMAGEFGHMTVVPGGHVCPCGNRGCWEQYSSGNALERDARQLAEARSPQAHALLEAVGSADRITGPDVSAAALAGDPMCVELISDVGHWLGLGLANLAAALDPELFVVGGGVSEVGTLLTEPAQRAFDRTLTGRGFRPPARLALAELGNSAGLIGAADLARQSIDQPPVRAGGFWPRRRWRPRRTRRQLRAERLAG
ncbi:ROK family glucokinase [Auraticoccus monumenti]|uniref:Glucokinase n=1 Tax=Auraticoccus monumenti TaxID=675864 RepID=A0A1G7DTH2_9ACTN|nr:ROK family glucokinase [Auraticoccus monumenti]SDE54470.1 glucokinase [Auraticoccus monumenti]